jgi:hypothetical protein
LLFPLALSGSGGLLGLIYILRPRISSIVLASRALKSQVLSAVRLWPTARSLQVPFMLGCPGGIASIRGRRELLLECYKLSKILKVNQGCLQSHRVLVVRRDGHASRKSNDVLGSATQP